ncbi:MAG: lipid-A-disaccharide synthase [Planctomycetaceae bacterium]|nr:lipid-A-disaccharide synthase [Planctomycetaceae bacterium]
MHLFFSAGEPSGDVHAAQVIAEIRRRRPEADISGFGGCRMEQAGCRQLYPLADLAVMGIWDVLPLLWTFLRLIRLAGRAFDQQRPDAVVLVDCPGFNWWIARQAKKRGIPVIYYLPPQLWAWAPWRIRKVRRFVDHVLSGLAFEVEWYRRRGIPIEFVGHPFFDEVAQSELDAVALRHLTRGNQRVVGILPGSRKKEVTRNFPVMLRMIQDLSARHPDVRFAVACYKDAHRDLCRGFMTSEHGNLPIELRVGQTSEIIEAAVCCLMVSGSVSLELLARQTPAVVMYRSPPTLYPLGKMLIRCRYLTLVNLLAGREVMPEFPFVRSNSPSVDRMVGCLNRWLLRDGERHDAVRDLAELRRAVAQTGGIENAASAILNKLEPAKHKRAA